MRRLSDQLVVATKATICSARLAIQINAKVVNKQSFCLDKLAVQRVTRISQFWRRSRLSIQWRLFAYAMRGVMNIVFRNPEAVVVVSSGI